MAENVRKTGDISGNDLGSNNNIMGDDVNQINIENEPKVKEALESIKNELQYITDEDDKNDADIYYESLEKYIKEKNTSKIKTCISNLRTYLSDTSNLLTIAQFFGLSISGIS